MAKTARSRAAARAAAPFEDVGGVRVERGGKNGYKHVRGGQGREENMYQGITPRKGNRTAHFATAKEAAVAFAKKRFVGQKQKGTVAAQLAATPTLAPMGVMPATASARLMPLVQCAPGVVPLSLRWSPQPLPVVRCVLLTREQAAVAAAHGVAMAMAE